MIVSVVMIKESRLEIIAERKPSEPVFVDGWMASNAKLALRLRS